MKGYTEEQLRDGRPTIIDAKEGVKFCLEALFADDEHCIEEGINNRLTFEELIGALLLMEDKIRDDEAIQEVMEQREPVIGDVDFECPLPRDGSVCEFGREMQEKHGVKEPTPDDSRCWGTVKEKLNDEHKS